jgi:UDP-N-acetylmuramyl pentapeptide phosphotransferase/UDP-N-acetylglucosamine-1-phosphate transferase
MERSWKHYITQKNIALFFWILNSTVYLYWLNTIKVSGFLSYISFTALLFGAGVSYDMVVKLRSLPDKTNRLKKLFPYFMGVFISCQLSTTVGRFFIINSDSINYIAFYFFYSWIFLSIYVAHRLCNSIDKVRAIRNV